MNKKKLIKIAAVLGAILLLVLAFHLIGSSLLPMMKNHFGL
jgi:hypothetical protein